MLKSNRESRFENFCKRIRKSGKAGARPLAGVFLELPLTLVRRRFTDLIFDQQRDG
jgi:hypothetical protein